MSRWSIILTTALSISIAAIILCSQFQGLLYDIRFYKKEFTRLNVREQVSEADSIASKLLDYFKNKKIDDYSIEEFSQREEKHLKDVKKLVDIGTLVYYTLVIAAIIMTAIMVWKQDIKTILLATQIGSGIAVMIILAGALFGQHFENIFTFLHPYFFEGSSWLFLKGDLLITIFPLQFFYDFTKEVMLRALMSSIFLGIATTTIRIILPPDRNTVIRKK